ncbi:inner membrane protein YdjM [Moorella mulderi DSM 14980]|uniref:Inner membrane protein YdjM n=2 Tax=Neomoorella TaxID=44260 RepID=A0A151ASU8_9FIRM|nr:inner membrane protein YdjM [Moorella mulderi DSM 14980]
MTGKTHAAAGAFAGALAGRLIGDPLTGMAIGAVAALLPDVDHPGSYVGRRLRPVSVLLEMAAGHRTVTHTVWFCAVVGILAALVSTLARPYTAVLHLPWWPTWPAAGLDAFLGALSHLALDALTRSGVEPLAPLLPLRLRGPLETGDPLVELPAATLFALAALRLAGAV